MNNMNQETNDNTDMTGMDSAGLKGVVRLSLRLKAVADFVKPGSRIADIGTDHGYVPIYLAQIGREAGAIAMDVRQGPLERAKEHIREYEGWAIQHAGNSRQQDPCAIEARLSDGLKELRPGEADTVIMAGMGGELEIRILEQGRHMWDSVSHWILSPQSDIHKVRVFLADNGFAIEDEAMVKDEGKYYTIMDVTRGAMSYLRPIWYRYGKVLLDRKDGILKEYLEKEQARVQGILEHFGAQEPEVPKEMDQAWDDVREMDRIQARDQAGIMARTALPMTEAQARARTALMEELGWIKEAQDEMQ